MALIRTQDISGKGNYGMYIDRFPRIYAAGIRTKQPDLRVTDCLRESRVPGTVNNSKSKNIQFPRVERSTASRDMRNAGPFTESSELINPPVITKFQTIVEDLKTTVYESYWNNQVGKRKDLTFALPPDLDINNTTFGRNTLNDLNNLYDIVMPKTCVKSEKILSTKFPGHQLQRNYCRTSFIPNIVNGIKSNADRSGKFVKQCLTDDKIFMGTSLKQPIFTARQKFQQRHNASLGTCLTPNNNIDFVPEGHVFGKEVPKDNNNTLRCLTYCELNPEREFFYKCLAHLNALRKCVSKKFDSLFFRNFYLQLRYQDKTLCGWLQKELIYRTCTNKFIRFTPNFIEPLLKMWKAIDDTNIEYKTFINIINFKEPLPELPKVWDIPSDFTDFCTTYKAMAMPQEPNESSTAGVPSGRYFDRDYPVTPDGCCKADRSYLPQESDAKACLSPSIFTVLGVTHREMFAEQKPENVKRVFLAAGEDINEHMFNIIWSRASKYHSKGLVSYETFRRALKEYKSKLNDSNKY